MTEPYRLGCFRSHVPGRRTCATRGHHQTAPLLIALHNSDMPQPSKACVCIARKLQVVAYMYIWLVVTCIFRQGKH